MASSDPKAFAEQWIAESLDLTPLTGADRERVIGGIRQCYLAAGIPWPDHVVWVGSPHELGLVAASARDLIQQRHDQRRREADPPARMKDAVSLVIWAGGRMMLLAAIGAVLAGLIRCLVLVSDWAGSDGNLFQATVMLALLYLTFITGVITLALVIQPFEDLARRRRAKFEPVGPDLAEALWSSLESAPQAAADDPETETGQLLSGLWHSLWDGHQAPPHLPDPRPSLDPQPGETIAMFSRDGLVGVSDPAAGSSIERNIAGLAWAHEHGTLALKDGGRDALEGLIAARRAFAWVPYRSLTIICGPPVELHRERAGSQWRLHHDGGPAVVWPTGDEPGEYFLHGVRIPRRLYRQEVDIPSLHYATTREVRRALIERMGWSRYVRRAELRLIAAVPDPGNTEAELKLYALPRSVHDSNRLLLMVNGSPDASGRHQDYGELVPDDYDDPIEAAAWQYGCPAEVYRRLARRT
jgi:hypothetical protein